MSGLPSAPPRAPRHRGRSPPTPLSETSLGQRNRIQARTAHRRIQQQLVQRLGCSAARRPGPSLRAHGSIRPEKPQRRKRVRRIARVIIAATYSVPGAPKRSTPAVSIAPPIETSSVGKAPATDRCRQTGTRSGPQACRRRVRRGAAASSRPLHQTVFELGHAARSAQRLDHDVGGLHGDGETRRTADVVRRRQKRDVRRAVGRRRETQSCRSRAASCGQLQHGPGARRGHSHAGQHRRRSGRPKRSQLRPPPGSGAISFGDELVRRRGQSAERQVLDARGPRCGLGLRRPSRRGRSAPMPLAGRLQVGPGETNRLHFETRPRRKPLARRSGSAAARSNGAVINVGAGRSSPSVTALIFTALMVTRHQCRKRYHSEPSSRARHSHQCPALIRTLHSKCRAAAAGLPGRLLVAWRQRVQAAAATALSRPPPAPRATATARRHRSIDATPAPAGVRARLRGEGLSSGDLYTAYRAMLDTYVDPVDQTPADPRRRPTACVVVCRPGRAADDDDAHAAGADPDRQRRQEIGRLSATHTTRWSARCPTGPSRAHPDWMVLRGMVASLNDGHTSFLTPDEARRRAGDELRRHRRAAVAATGRSAAADRRDLPEQSGRPAAA